MDTLALPTKTINPGVLLRATAPFVAQTALLSLLQLGRERRHLRMHRRTHRSTLFLSRPAMTVGATALGALAVGAFSIGALAVGALAIGKLSLGKAELKQVHIHSLQVDALSLPSAAT